MDIDTLINARKMQKIGAHSKISHIKIKKQLSVNHNNSTHNFHTNSAMNINTSPFKQ